MEYNQSLIASCELYWQETYLYRSIYIYMHTVYTCGACLQLPIREEDVSECNFTCYKEKNNMCINLLGATPLILGHSNDNHKIIPPYVDKQCFFIP